MEVYVVMLYLYMWWPRRPSIIYIYIFARVVLIQVIRPFYMQRSAVQFFWWHVSESTGIWTGSPGPSRLRVPVRPDGILGLDKSGIRAVRPSESTKPCLRRVLFIGVLCTTSINRRLWTFRNCFFSSCLRSCDRAYIVYEVIVDHWISLFLLL